MSVYGELNPMVEHRTKFTFNPNLGGGCWVVLPAHPVGFPLITQER